MQDGGGRHFEKTVKSPYLCNRLTDFDEIWHADADWPPTGGVSLNFQFLKNQDGGGSHLEKSQKLRYHSIFAEFGMIMQNGSLNHPDR